MGERAHPMVTVIRERLRTALPAFIGLVLFFAALEVLRTELRAVTWHGLTTDLSNIPAWHLVFAVLLTAVNYGVLTGYDFLAFAYLGKRLPARRVAMASFLAYAISNNVGFAMLSGASIRYRFYTRWGITAEELSRIVFSYVVTFWLGLLLVGGLSLARSPLPRDLGLPMAFIVAPLGWLLMLISIGYVIAATLRLGPIRLRRLELPLPSPPLALAQLALSVLDWTIAATVLYVLLPPGGIPFLALLGAFLASQLLGPRQSRPRRHGRVRRADGAVLEAVYLIDDSAAGAHRLSCGVLPAAAVGRGNRTRGRRAPSAPVASGTTWRCARMVDRAAHAAGACRVHLPGRGRTAGFGRHTGGTRPSRYAQSSSPTRRH